MCQSVKIRIHYNRFKVKQGLPWTLHTYKKCYSASHIRITVPCSTEEKPHLRSNPRYFILVEGEIEWDGSVAIVVRGKDD